MTKNTLTRNVNCILIPFFNWCHYQLSVFRFYFAKILPFPQGILLFHRPAPSLDINHRPGAKCLKPLKQQKKHMYIHIQGYTCVWYVTPNVASRFISPLLPAIQKSVCIWINPPNDSRFFTPFPPILQF